MNPPRYNRVLQITQARRPVEKDRWTSGAIDRRHSSAGNRTRTAPAFAESVRPPHVEITDPLRPIETFGVTRRICTGTDAITRRYAAVTSWPPETGAPPGTRTLSGSAQAPRGLKARCSSNSSSRCKLGPAERLALPWRMILACLQNRCCRY